MSDRGRRDDRGQQNPTGKFEKLPDAREVSSMLPPEAAERRAAALQSQASGSDTFTPTVLLRRGGEIALIQTDKKPSTSTSTTRQPSTSQPSTSSGISFMGRMPSASQPCTSSKMSYSEARKKTKVPRMEKSIPLVENKIFNKEGVMQYLKDQPDFLVIGCLGQQGVGKSTIMSKLASGTSEKMVFDPQTVEDLLTFSHRTNNIDIYVSEHSRILYIDTPPLLSLSMMRKKKRGEGSSRRGRRPYRLMSSRVSKTRFLCEPPPFKNEVEVYSMQIICFLLSVCHVVIVMDDWFFNSEILKLFHSLELMKPKLQTMFNNRDLIDYYPHIVFLQNKVSSSEFSPKTIDVMQDAYSRFFEQLPSYEIRSEVSITRTDVIKELDPDQYEDPVNLFLLPNMYEKIPIGDENDSGAEGLIFSQVLQKFKECLLKIEKLPLTERQLTEKSWLHYTSQIWEIVKRSYLFAEFDQVLSMEEPR